MANKYAGTQTEKNLLAAFAGEDCLGVAELVDSLYFLFINSPKEQTEAAKVSLRYYSTQYKNLFVAADAFAYVNNDTIGTYNTPYVPAFVVEQSK